MENEGLDAVYARHARLAEGVRRAVFAWGMTPFAASADLYSDTVTAVKVPEGCNGTDLVQLAASKYGMAFGVGLARWRARCSASGIWMLTDAMVLSGLCVAEMCMADLGWPVRLVRAWRRRRNGIAVRLRPRPGGGVRDQAPGVLHPRPPQDTCRQKMGRG